MGFKERADVVGVIVEERGVAIGSLQRLPVYVPPFVVFGDAEGSDGDGLMHCISIRNSMGGGGKSVFHRHGKRLRTVGRGYGASVAGGALMERFRGINITGIGSIELPIPGYGAEISGRKDEHDDSRVRGTGCEEQGSFLPDGGTVGHIT